MSAQFDAAEALLKEIQAETAAVRAAVEEQKEKVDKTTQDVDAVVKEMREGEIQTRDEMREIREEVNNIRDMLPKVPMSFFVFNAFPDPVVLADDREEQRKPDSISC